MTQLADDPFSPPSQRPGHGRSLSAPGPAAPAQNPAAAAAAAPPSVPRPQPRSQTAASSAGSVAELLQSRPMFGDDPFAPSGDGGAGSAQGASGFASPAKPPAAAAAQDPFAPKPHSGLGVASAAARLAATPPAKVLRPAGMSNKQAVDATTALPGSSPPLQGSCAHVTVP